MITRVELTNFQAHKKLDLTLGKLTTLTGPSNSGKTAVLRAIAGLLRNDSAGSLVRHGASKMTVRLHLEDGHVVTWVKGKTANQYDLTRPDGTTSTYQKVGAGVPDEVQEALRIGPITLEDGTKTHLNLHEQADAPFLVFDTPGSVAKVMGELTSAGKLFSAANEGNRRTREDKKRKAIRQEDADKAKAELAAFDDLDELTEKMACVESVLVEARTLSAAVESLGSCLSSLSSTAVEMSTVESAIPPLEAAEKLDLQQLSALQAAISSLWSLMETLWSAENGVTASADEIERLEPLANTDLSALTTINDAVLALSGLVNEYNSILEERDSYSADHSIHLKAAEYDLGPLVRLEGAILDVECLVSDYYVASEAIIARKAEISAAEKELAEVEADLASIDVCYTCGQSLTDDAREHMLHG